MTNGSAEFRMKVSRKPVLRLQMGEEFFGGFTTECVFVDFFTEKRKFDFNYKQTWEKLK